MATEIEDKLALATPDAPPQAAATSPQPDDGLPEDNRNKSWGEKYKDGTFSFIRNWVVNYFINFLIGATTTYAFDTSSYGARFRAWTDKKIEQYDLTRNNSGLSRFLLKFVTRTQLLLCGGHAILPVVKWMHDNEKHIEFALGHRLDALQELVGMGNEASRRSMGEYNRIRAIMAAGQGKSGKAEDLSDEDKLLLAKNSINDKLQFKEHRLTWWKTIKARLSGMAVTTSMSIVMALTSSAKWKYARFEETYEEPIGKFLGNVFIRRIPFVSKIFNKPLNGLSGNELIGKYFVDDMIFTAGSKTGFDLMESHHQKLEAAEAKKLEEAAQKAEVAARWAENAASKLEAIERKVEAREEKSRKHILANGPKDMLARAEKTPETTAMALS